MIHSSPTSRTLRHLLALLLAATVASLAGCGQKEAEPEAAAATTTEAPASEAAAPAEDSGSTTDSIVLDATQQVTPADYEAAVKGKDYVRAADAILRMNAQNTAGANSVSRMHELQDEVARGVANGDPNAKRAAEMLRRIGRMPSQPGGN
jgi:predicted small lipoprotein YifL